LFLIVKATDRSDSVAHESAVLVGVITHDVAHDVDPLEELAGLATTAGVRIAGRLTQHRDHPEPATCLGSGKVEELKTFVEALKADVVLFDNDLTPAQTRNLEQGLGVKVIDRTELILDIFATHAQTAESRLAVELAQLEYSLPRLKRMWTHLSRLKTGIGMRGPGEKQLEVDRRLVEKRIHDLRHELQDVEKRKAREVRARRGFGTVSIVGYTNAGKSTLMNALTGAGVRAMDKLFATLDTRTRRWQLPSWGPVLLSDTVGFIKNLPHRLIASFKSTLEEARQANLLLHVADASNAAVFDQLAAVYSVLEEIGIEAKDTLLVLNKIDAVTDQSLLDAVMHRYPHAIPVSARKRLGLDELAVAVSDALSHAFREVDIETGLDNGRLMAWLAEHGEVLGRQYHEDHVVLHCRLPEEVLGRIQPAEAKIRPHERNGHLAKSNGQPHEMGSGPADSSQNAEKIDNSADPN